MDRPLPLLPAMSQLPLLLALATVNKHIPGRAVPPVPAGGRGNDPMNCRRSHRRTMRSQLRNGDAVLGQEITQRGIFPSFSLSLRRSFLSVNEVGRKFMRGLQSGQGRTIDQNGIANPLKPSTNRYLLSFPFPDYPDCCCLAHQNKQTDGFCKASGHYHQSAEDRKGDQ